MHQRFQAQRHQPALPCIAGRDDVRRQRVAEELFRQALRIEGLDLFFAGNEAHLLQ